MVIILILACLILLYTFKLNENANLIKEYCKSDSDVVNIKNGQKYFYKSRFSIILLVALILSLVICLLCNFTNIDNAIMDYISTEIWVPKDFNYKYYYIPTYLFFIREIIVQVRIGDFLYKYFKIEEPGANGSAIKDILMKILYKKKPETTINNSDNKRNES